VSRASLRALVVGLICLDAVEFCWTRAAILRARIMWRLRRVSVAAFLTMSCARPLPPLPMPPTDDSDYCSQPHVMRVEEWRALCGQEPRALVLDAGGR